MTDFEGNESGHESCGFEALDTKSTWSSFDEITWDSFGGDDHSVPDPDEPSEPLWLRGSAGRRKEGKSMMRDEGTKLEETSSMDVDDWESLDVSELGAVPESLIPENALIVKESSPDDLLAAGLLDGEVFNEEDASIVTSSGPFPYVPTEEDLELFASESDVDKRGSFLGYNWESLQDMDNLFQNEESTFGSDGADALLQWPSSASSPDSNAAVPANLSPELRAMKGKSQDEDVKMEFIPCDMFEKSTGEPSTCMNKPETVVELCAKNSEVDKALDDQELAAQSTVRDKLPVDDNAKPSTSQKGKEQRTQEVEKVQTLRRQNSGRKREDRSKKLLYAKKAGQNIIQPKPQSLTHYSSAQVKPTVAATLQVYPHAHGPAVAPAMMGVNPAMQQRQPYLHSHSSMGGVHQSPYVIQGQVQHQPVMMCYDRADQRQQYEQQKQLEALGPPPASGANMTPQEKLDKLRWKQKMQRLASDQQQQIVKSIDPPSGKLPVQKPAKLHGKQQPELDTVNSPVTKPDEAEERAVEATVLSQLLDIMTKKLDVGTRICIRDALYRLSKGALNRHATDGASSSECSNNAAGDHSLSRTIRYPVLETPTNPIDRSIINLLFRRNTGTVLALPSLPAATRTRTDWNSWQGGTAAPALETEGNGKQQQTHRQQQQERTTGGEQSADISSEDIESEGSSRKPKTGGTKSLRGSLKRAASNEFLSSQEDTGGRGTSSSSDSPRDCKAAKTALQALQMAVTPMQGTLFKYGATPIQVGFRSGSFKRQVVFIGGLTDGFMATEYLNPLAKALEDKRWSLVQFLMSSSHSGYGTSSLKQDAMELEQLVSYLLDKEDSEGVVLMGHSTGCQDIVHFLRVGGSCLSAIRGTILQAPVSDREYRATLPTTAKMLKLAESMIKEGREMDLMPLEAEPDVPMTAHRYHSLAAFMGDDDMFSSDLSDEQLHLRLQHMSKVPCQILFSMADEYVPKEIDKQKLVSRLGAAMGGAETVEVEDGNHSLSNKIFQVVEVVCKFIARLN